MNGWEFLGAAIAGRPGQPWTEAHSDRLDRLVREARARQQREVEAAFPKPTNDRRSGRTVEGPHVPPRGVASAAEVERRKRADAYFHRLALEAIPSDPRWPTPKPTPDGRWQAKCIHQGVKHRQIFDTEQEARQFIAAIKKGTE